MNESIFLVHTLTVLLCTLITFRLGSTALSGWICLQAILANLFVLKQVVLFGFNVTCSDVFAIGGILSLNLLQERFGAELAKKTVSYCFYFMLFFALLSQIHLFYAPSPVDNAHASYAALLSVSPRLLIASLASFFGVQKLDIALFSRIRNRFSSSSFSLRALLSLLGSQLLDTLLFSFLGLYGIVESMFDLILLSFVIKSFVIVASVAFVHTTQKWIQTKEFSL